PTSIDGEPVVSGVALSARGQGDPFLAGGTLVLVTAGDEWRLVVGGIAEPTGTYELDGVTQAPGFVPTSGALTVARVHALEGSVLVVDSIVSRQPTKGPIPDEATPPGGGETNEALWPDYVSEYGRDGVTIAGDIPKRFLLDGVDPQPVYGEDLTTLVGHMVAGVGYQAL